MSLINRMLNDLDARRADTPAGAIAPVPRSSAGKLRLPLLVLGGAALVSAAAFGNWPTLLGGVSSAGPRPVVIAADGDVPPSAPPSALAGAPNEAVSVPIERVATASTAPMPTTAGATPPASPPAAVPTAPPALRLALALQASPAPRLPIAPRVPERAASAALPTALPAATPAVAADSGAPASIEKKMREPSGTQRAALAYRQAVERAGEGHSSAAITEAVDALKADPDHLGARELAAVLMFESNRFAEAGALLRDGLQRLPQQPRLTLLLARLEAETGDSAAALARLAQVPSLGGDGQGLRGALLAREGRFDEALQAYEAAVRQQPGNASWWLGLGVALDAQGQGPLARQALQRARSLGSLRGDALAYVDQKLGTLE
jgi:MSHA biogenesis protein MshN